MSLLLDVPMNGVLESLACAILGGVFGSGVMMWWIRRGQSATELMTCDKCRGDGKVTYFEDDPLTHPQTPSRTVACNKCSGSGILEYRPWK